MWAVNMLPWRAQAKAKLRFQIQVELGLLAVIVLAMTATVQCYVWHLHSQRQAQLETLRKKVSMQAALVASHTQKQAQQDMVKALPEFQDMQRIEWQSIAECMRVLEAVKGSDIALHTLRYQWPVVRVLGSAVAELRVFDFVERIQQKLPMATVKVEQLKSTGRRSARDLFEFSMEIKQKHPSWIKSEYLFKPSLQDSNTLIEPPV